MTTPLYCLVLFATWGLVLVAALLAWRGLYVLRGAAINSFPGGQKHGSEPYWRLNRAQANVLENLPYFAVVVLIAALLRYESPLFDTLSQLVVGARLGQTTAHLASGGKLAVTIRFSFFATQLVCFVVMGLLVTGLV